MIELPVLQNLSRRQRDRCVLGKLGAKLDPAGQILPEVQNAITPGRVNQFLHRETVLFPHREGETILKRPAFLGYRRLDTAQQLGYGTGIPDFAVINVGKADRRREFFPAFIRGSQERAALIELRDGVKSVAVEIGIAALKTQAAFEPALPQRDHQLIFTLTQKRCHVIGLILICNKIA